MLLAAEISPDETKVAAIAQNKVQVWDFRSGTVVAEAELPAWSFEAGVPQVSYSVQGDFLVVCVERVLHVLRAGDLKEVRQIVIPDEIGTVRYQGHYKPSEGHTSVKSVQLSPVANLAAVLIGHLALGDRLEIYDLTTGAKMRSWSMNQEAWTCVWHSDGRRVFVVTGDWSRNNREIVELDVATGARAVVLAVAIPVSSIAVTSDQRVFVVDGRPKGVFIARDPTLRVFDLASGKMVHEFGGRGNGVRYRLSVSRDGRRLVAFTGIQKMEFNWEYLVYVPQLLDRTLSVWDLRNNQGTVTSQDLQGLENNFFSISTGGHFVVISGQHPQVVELP
jgi:WD40 repeat protein